MSPTLKSTGSVKLNADEGITSSALYTDKSKPSTSVLDRFATDSPVGILSSRSLNISTSRAFLGAFLITVTCDSSTYTTLLESLLRTTNSLVSYCPTSSTSRV